MNTINVNLRPAWRNYWLGLLLTVLLLLMSALAAISGGEAGWGLDARVWLLLALLALGFVAVKRFSWKFTIDESRVARHYGLISRNQQSVRIKDLRSIELNQTLMQRIFGIGDLAFYSAGSAAAEVKFVGIKSPAAWRDKIDTIMDQLKDSYE